MAPRKPAFQGRSGKGTAPYEQAGRVDWLKLAARRPIGTPSCSLPSNVARPFQNRTLPGRQGRGGRRGRRAPCVPRVRRRVPARQPLRTGPPLRLYAGGGGSAAAISAHLPAASGATAPEWARSNPGGKGRGCGTLPRDFPHLLTALEGDKGRGQSRSPLKVLGPAAADYTAHSSRPQSLPLCAPSLRFAYTTKSTLQFAKCAVSLCPSRSRVWTRLYLGWGDCSFHPCLKKKKKKK